MKMKGSIILKIFLILLCGALLVAFAGLILWDRQQQQADNARLRQLIELDQAETDQTSEKTDDGKESSEDAEAKEDISDGTTSETTDQQEEETEPEVPVQGIACWGDELLSSDDAATYSYKVVLQNLLNENGYSLTVADKTLNGASTLSIMKMAGVPQADLDAYVAKHQEAAGGAELPIEETTMRDLTSEQMQRTEADYIPVIFMGYYGGWNHDPNELIEQQQKILDTFGSNKDKYIIVGSTPQDGSVDGAAYDAAMTEAWGEHYISTGTLTNPRASYDGQAEIANEVYQKLLDLNYISKQ